MAKTLSVKNPKVGDSGGIPKRGLVVTYKGISNQTHKAQKRPFEGCVKRQITDKVCFSVVLGTNLSCSF